jgi:MFS family permease
MRIDSHRSSLSATRSLLSNRELRRVQLALTLTQTCTPAYAVALAVYAFGRGGAAAVGIVGLVALLPAALAAPFAAHLADRCRRERVMLYGALSRGLLIALACVALALEMSEYTIYALAALASIPSRVFFPAQAALLPSLTRSASELTAANAFSSMIENVGSILGPALAGALLTFQGPVLVYALAATGTLTAAALVSRVHGPAQTRARETEHQSAGVLGGFRTIGAHAELRLLVGLFSAQTFVYGIFSVLLIVIAFDLSALGASGVGALEGALGFGGILAGIASVGIAGRGHGSQLRLGLVLWGLPLALIGIWPTALTAITLFAVIGVGNTLFDVAIYTLVQEVCPDGVRARVFGVLESMAVGTVALGSILAPGIIALAGPRAILIVTGTALAILPLITARQLEGIHFDHALEPQPISISAVA